MQLGIVKVLVLSIVSFSGVHCNKHASQLYEDLMYSYNRVVRPVKNASDSLTVKFGASLIRIIDVDSKNQIYTTNLWLELQWVDSKLQWDPDDYGGIAKIHMPADQIWLPDVVLYNNAAGDPEISIYTDALIYHNGVVLWKPPAIYKSFCPIDVRWFPYDWQACEMKFGLWTHTGRYVDLRQLPHDEVKKVNEIEEGVGVDGKQEYLDKGMDLSYYYENAEWDLLNLTSLRFEQVYGTCCGPETYVDIRYYFTLRRKPLFYTINLIIPCALISFLTTFVFYLPADPGGHQLTFSISILVTLTVFFLVLIELIPPTSLVIPLFGKYLLFTMVLVTLSIVISVMCVNCHHRSGSTHIMPPWIRYVFIEKLPKLLFMERPQAGGDDDKKETPAVPPSAAVVAKVSTAVANTLDVINGNKPGDSTNTFAYDYREHSPFLLSAKKRENMDHIQRRIHAQIIRRVLANVQFIANHFKEMEDDDDISNDWSYVAMVIDRLFLMLFTIANIVGTMFIILQAPTHYDTRVPMKLPSPTKPLGGDTLGQMYSF